MSKDSVFGHIELLRCPVCRTAFSHCGSSLRCENGHTFDPSRKGSVNFAPNAAPSRYEAKLFEARRRILEAGFYDAIIRAIDASIPAHAQTVLDAGCGDGTFTKALQRNTTVGIDLSKDAIRLAAQGSGRILWMVGDLTRLPIRNGSVDVILNIFSPAHYAEFARVLKPGGQLLKLVPEENYLREIRDMMGDALRNETYSNEAVIANLQNHFQITERTRIRNKVSVTPEQARDFLTMTPLTFCAEPDALDPARLTEITIDAELLITVPTKRHD